MCLSNVSLSIYHHHRHVSSTHFSTQLPFDRSRKSTRVRNESVCAEREKKAIKFSTGFWGIRKKEPTTSMIGYQQFYEWKFHFSLRASFPNASSVYRISCPHMWKIKFYWSIKIRRKSWKKFFIDKVRKKQEEIERVNFGAFLKAFWFLSFLFFHSLSPIFSLSLALKSNELSISSGWIKQRKCDFSVIIDEVLETFNNSAPT